MGKLDMIRTQDVTLRHYLATFCDAIAKVLIRHG